MEDPRSSNLNTLPGLREIDLATDRAQYVREHKTGAVSEDHMSETHCQVRHIKISKPRPLPISKSPRSPRPRTHSKLYKPRPPHPMPSSFQRDPHQPPPTLPPLDLGETLDPEPALSTSAHLPVHLDLDQADESLTSFRDRRAGIVLQLETQSAFRETSPGDLARSLFEARIARRKSYLGHPDYYIPRSVKTRASVVSQAPSTARLNALETPTESLPPLPDFLTLGITSTPPIDKDEEDVMPRFHAPAIHASASLRRAVSDVVENRSPRFRFRISSLLNPISRGHRRVVVEEVEDEGTPPAPRTPLPITSSFAPTREASIDPSDVVERVAWLQLSDSSSAAPSLDEAFVDAPSHLEEQETDEPPPRVFAVPVSSTAWCASRGIDSVSRMSTVLEEELSPVPASPHLPSSHSASTASLEHSVFTHEQPSGDGPDTSGTSLSAHARTPPQTAESLPFVPRRLSRAASLVVLEGEKPLPTLPSQAGVGPSSADRMYWISAGGVTASRPWRPEVQGGRKLVRKRAQHALHLDTDSDEDLRTFRLQLAARPADQPAGWYRRNLDKPLLSVTSFGSLLGVRFRNDCRIDFGADGQGGEGPVSPTIYEYIS